LSFSLSFFSVKFLALYYRRSGFFLFILICFFYSSWQVLIKNLVTILLIVTKVEGYR
jgi:hypothetical protein